MLDWALNKPLVDFKNKTHRPWRFFQQKYFVLTRFLWKKLR